MASEPAPTTPYTSIAAWYAETVCSDCQAARLLHWKQEGMSIGGRDVPQHAVSVSGQWAAVHCDYFRRRVEMPDQLMFCAAQRTG